MRRHGEVANEVCRVAPEVGEDDKVWFDPKPKILPTNLDHGKTSRDMSMWKHKELEVSLWLGSLHVSN